MDADLFTNVIISEASAPACPWRRPSRRDLNAWAFRLRIRRRLLFMYIVIVIVIVYE